MFLPAASTASRATLSGTTWPGLPVGELTVETAGGTKKCMQLVVSGWAAGCLALLWV